jgi:hypothetical protein
VSWPSPASSQRVLDDDAVAELPLFAGDPLRIFVAFSSDEYDIVYTGLLDGVGNRPMSIMLDPNIGMRGQASADISNDYAGVFVPRIVVGQHDMIRESRRGRTHGGSFTGVTLPSATEHAPQLSAADSIQILEYSCQCGRRVRIVDDDPRLVPTATEYLHAAGETTTLGKRFASLDQRHIPSDERAQREQKILRIEIPDQRGHNDRRFSRSSHFEFDSIQIGRHDAAGDVGISF